MPPTGSTIVSRGKASGQMSLTGGVKGTNCPPPVASSINHLVTTSYLIVHGNVLRHALDCALVCFM